MSYCNPDSSAHVAQEPCPKCDTSCKNVVIRTLYHQVRFPENQDIAPESYYYCPHKNCSVGYFTLTGLIIPKQHLRTVADIEYNKLCYCFDIDVAQYMSALEDKSAEAIKSFVIQLTKSGDCGCETRNPSGRCCLADFKKLEKEYSRQE